ncbi:hypothetical protein [uncultured Clostridium sp.]|uniref:hypothetical protein n=1 Tax=uncultured Clostridium sp. TaxID=59620 RepID=UPI0025E31DD8|nr:hypothetical protein [uncultured Clostridium sp.]
MKKNIGISMYIRIKYEFLEIPGLEDLIVLKKNYNIRQSKKFIKKLLEYDYNYLKEGDFEDNIYNQDLMIECWNDCSGYVFITTLKNRKPRKIYHNA